MREELRQNTAFEQRKWRDAITSWCEQGRARVRFATAVITVESVAKNTKPNAKSPNVNSGQVQIIGPNGEVWDEEKDLQEVEDLFETYFTHIDSTFRNLEQLNEYIDDMEDLIEIELDSKRNQLIKLELLLTTGTLCLSGFGVVVGVFGMNIRNGLEGSQSSFELVIVFSVIGSVLTFAAIVQACRYFRLF